MEDDLVLRVVGKLLIPFILVFAVYVLFHAKYSPGGGFQGGAIFAAGLIFYALIFGIDQARRLMPGWLVDTAITVGTLLFIGVGFAGLLLGGNYLDYFVLAADPIAGQQLGIFLVEAGVFVTVSAVLLKIFYMFASRDDGDTAP